ncbi:MAG: glycosyltransferase family 2 protein [Methylovirgula sp.]|uniref:glycosyltransferase family 2 protein n=1 Tax=Methylovirgula sp. TaxID=1978224 RepID=UPI0030761128
MIEITSQECRFIYPLALPEITVIITCYNYSKFLIAAAKSVQDQTYPNFECLVVDDCSTDDSFDKISDFIRETDDSRFRCLRLGKNLGQMGAIKAGIENSTAPFIVLMDADDLIITDFLKTHLEAHLNSSFSAALTASDTIQINEHGHILESTFHSLSKFRTHSEEDAKIKEIPTDALGNIFDNHITFKKRPASIRYIEPYAEGWNVVAMSSLMFRRDVLELIMPDNVDRLRICADFYLVTYAHSIAGTITISESLSAFRMHRKNNFSFNPILGGRHLPGHFPSEHSDLIRREIANHIVIQFDILSRVLGAARCNDMIARYGPIKNVSSAETQSSPLENGRGRKTRRGLGFFKRTFESAKS